MSIIESRWRERQTRHEDGIYFGTDEFIELCGTPSGGYRADLLAPITLLLQSVPDGWTGLDEICSTRFEDYIVVGGSTSSEAAGFIALECCSSGRLIRLIHLSDSEPFVEVSCDGSTIRAISEEYPFRSEWSMPVNSPESLTVAPVHET